jgi:hypothetical protein
MRITWTRLIFIALIGAGAFQHYCHDTFVHGPGVLAAEDPQQTTINLAEPQTIRGYQITPLADFNIKARVLASANYYLGREAELSPVDLALGWGRMSDEAVLKQIDIRQSNRFYYWHVEEFPIPRQEIESHSANMHMIPADARIEKILKSARVGQLVQLRGYLVEAKSADGWRWQSSLTRHDSGNGACELLLVQSAAVL